MYAWLLTLPESTCFPLTAAELAFRFDVDDALRFGMLPTVRSESAHAIDILEAHSADCIKEENQHEAPVKNLDSFTRFLEIAALMHGQVVNTTRIACDAGVARPTVQRYFEVLSGTLIGVWLPAWRPRARVKEVAHPKFHFFDRASYAHSCSDCANPSMVRSEGS